MTPLIVGFFLVQAASGTGQSNDAVQNGDRRAVSIQEAMKLASLRNPDLAAARASAAQVAAKSRLVYSAILPEIVLQGSYVYSTAEQRFDPSLFLPLFEGSIETSLRGTGMAYGLPTPANDVVVDAVKTGFRDAVGEQLKPVTIVAHNSMYGSALFQQVLFNPQFLLIPAAGESEEAARLGALEAREQILLGVGRLYLGIEGLEQLERASRDAEQVALKRERDAQAQIGVGSATEIALLRAQSETAQARMMLATLSGQREALLAQLEALVGEAIRPPVDVPTRFEISAASSDAEQWRQSYLIRSLKLALQAQERFNTVDRIAWLPSIVAQAKGNYNSNLGFAGTNWTFDGILSAQWTLYDRGQRYVQRRENDAKTVELQAKLRGAVDKARATWIGAKSNLSAAAAALQQAESQEQLAIRAQKHVESAFQAGFTTSLEVSDIDSKRFLAASSAAQTRAQLEIRKLELAAAEGRLAQFLGVNDDTQPE